MPTMFTSFQAEMSLASVVATGKTHVRFTARSCVTGLVVAELDCTRSTAIWLSSLTYYVVVFVVSSSLSVVSSFIPRSSDVLDQKESISNHTWKGIEFLDRYGSFLKDRQNVEIDYAKSLR
ncbi:unnamed protein product [Soboliphyme baturini]|uniref:PAC domain-containing protein n=1 Tax=Soboliphyme baturini TaxID=241478 RepID=A0A183IHB3_9BILA|nr:unnamed protein product [Soboliphyme baturini]